MNRFVQHLSYRSLPLGALMGLCCHVLAITAAADDFTSRSDLALIGATADMGRLDGTSPMHYWVAQQLFERGENEGALKIVSSGVRFMRQAIE